MKSSLLIIGLVLILMGIYDFHIFLWYGSPYGLLLMVPVCFYFSAGPYLMYCSGKA